MHISTKAACCHREETFVFVKTGRVFFLVCFFFDGGLLHQVHPQRCHNTLGARLGKHRPLDRSLSNLPYKYLSSRKAAQLRLGIAINYASEAQSSLENNMFNPLLTASTVQKTLAAGTAAAAATCTTFVWGEKQDGRKTGAPTPGRGCRHSPEGGVSESVDSCHKRADFQKWVFLHLVKSKASETGGKKKTFRISAEFSKTLLIYS